MCSETLYEIVQVLKGYAGTWNSEIIFESSEFLGQFWTVAPDTFLQVI